MITSLFLFFAQVAAPEISNLEIATLQGSQLEILGTGFGPAHTPGFLVLESGSHRKLVPATAANIVSWQNTRILIDVPDDAVSGTVRVLKPTGISQAAKVEVFAYDYFDIPPTSGTNASPLSLTVDDQQRVWINEEFHRQFQKLDIATGTVSGVQHPYPPGPGPFASTIFNDHRTRTSALGEGVIVDPMGRVWFSEGGGYLYSGAHPNHSRIICMLPDEPGGPEFRVYNVPGDWNEAMGLAWDSTRNWIWFAQGGLDAGAKVVGFDPELIPWDNQFDFSTSLDHLIGTPGDPGDAVYHFYDVPNLTAQPAHLIVKDNGDIWFTHYWGRAIGRLQPDTNVVTTYPVPDPISKAIPSYIVGAGPWEIKEAPNGDIVFNEFFDATITRFDISRQDDPLAMQLDVDGKNPAMSDWVMPRYDPRVEQMHSIAYDLEGRLWYTIHVANELGHSASLGYITPDWQQMTRIPPMEDDSHAGAWCSDGIAVDPTSGDLYFCEFWRKRIGRLHYIEPL